MTGELRVRLTAPQEKVLRALVRGDMRSTYGRGVLGASDVAELVYGDASRANNAIRVLYALRDHGLVREFGVYHWSATQAGRWFVEDLPE